MEFSIVQWFLTNQLSTRIAIIRAKWRHDARSIHSVAYPRYRLWRQETVSSRVLPTTQSSFGTYLDS